MKKQPVLATTLAIEMWDVDRPKPYAQNARKISETAVDKVAASIREFGFRQPIVVDEAGVIIMGHTRQRAAVKLGLKQVPVHVARGLTPAQVRSLRLADNRTHEETSWDDALLKLELKELHDLGIDLSQTAFSGSEIDKLLRPDADPDPADATPPLEPDPVSRLGNVWILGKHRVMCGDSTSTAAVTSLLTAPRPGLMVTDPPYGVDYDPKWRLDAGVNKKHQTRAEGVVKNDSQADWRLAYELFPGAVAYVWHGGLHAGEVQAGLASAGFEVRAQIIWAKGSPVIGRGAYHWQHEPCFYAVRKGETAAWKGDRKQTTLWAIANMHRTQGKVDDGKTNHSTQKPVECMRRPLLNHIERGATVYDPFLGSGSTLMAAETTERICFGMELDPRYVDMTVKRWQDFSGKMARLEASGSPTFGAISEARADFDKKGKGRPPKRTKRT